MSTRPSVVTTVILALAIILVPESRAEVAAETDAYGNYVRTTILAQSSVRQVRIWKAVRRHAFGVHALNPEGDRAGDQYPAIAENPASGNHPWAVWSRFNGADFDLVWSRWTSGEWSAIGVVEEAAAPGDDLGPQVVFDGGGRPYLAWWREDENGGRVFLSFFLVTHWMAPVAISDPGVDSRNPRLGVQADGSVVVEYDTPAGKEARVVSVFFPATITDDINPFPTVRRGTPGGP